MLIKKYTYLLLAIILFMLAASACKKSKVSPKKPIDELPLATQEGKFTFGCLVNGEAFVQRIPSKMTAIYQNGFLHLGAQSNNKEFKENISIDIYDPIEINKKYELTQIPKNRAKFIKYPSQVDNPTKCYYDFKNTHSGHVIFTRLDRQKYIVSGTFEYTTVVDNCDTIKITDGRFDMQYIP